MTNTANTALNATGWYGDVFKRWPKTAGEKPTAAMLATIHRLGARPGKQAMAIAMSLRPAGVTNSQIVAVCGNPQLNKMRGFVADRLLKRLPAPATELNHTVYKHELTPKGQQRIDNALKREAAADAEAAAKPDKPAKKAAVKKAAKAKGASKPRKAAKGPATETAITEAANATAKVQLPDMTTATADTDQPQA